jgi:drug/metabolite transporter (DMT)-like permease
LDASLAVHNAFITGLEPVITIVLARIFLREQMRAAGWMILAIALVGFALLSGVGGSWRELVQATYLWGNVLLLLGMAGEAMYSILGAPLVKRIEPVTAFSIALATGAALLTVFVVATGMTPSLSQFSSRSVIGLFWTGPITTAFCYLVWLTSLRHVPVNAAAFTLFIQPVLGAVMGYWLLGERLGGLQLVGAGLILVSLAMYAKKC